MIHREIVLVAPVEEGLAVTLEALAPAVQVDQVAVAVDAQLICVAEKPSTCHLNCRLL